MLLTQRVNVAYKCKLIASLPSSVHENMLTTVKLTVVVLVTVVLSVVVLVTVVLSVVVLVMVVVFDVVLVIILMIMSVEVYVVGSAVKL